MPKKGKETLIRPLAQELLYAKERKGKETLIRPLAQELLYAKERKGKERKEQTNVETGQHAFFLIVSCTQNKKTQISDYFSIQTS